LVEKEKVGWESIKSDSKKKVDDDAAVDDDEVL
jgi:hypothetical protein